MKKHFLILSILLGLYIPTTLGQTIDTNVVVDGGYKLHFVIIKGKGTPILFESGAGDGANIWKDITPQVASVTGATVIAYDRIGFGPDSMVTPIGFVKEIKALELGLQKLGYGNKNIMLVAHSMGGLYNTYYASRHPKEVKAAIFIEVASACTWNANFKDPAFVAQAQYILKDLKTMADTTAKHPMPLTIPVIDIVAENQELDENGNIDSVHDKIWFDCHKDFVSQSPFRKSIFAYGADHYVFINNPSLVVNAIVTQYANYVEPQYKAVILEKGYEMALTMANESNKNELKNGRREEDLNLWGYYFLSKNEIDKAISVFELNAKLNPNSWNAYDSLGEAHLKAGNMQAAFKNYKKSLELNPENKSAVEALKELGK